MDNYVKRTFIPGENWIYFKLYTGYKTADTILSNTLPVIISQLNTQNILDKWFFIRYSDPKFHLRLRFCVNDTKNISTVISVFNQEIAPYIDGDLVWKVQIDTYQRELERYGATSMEYSESIFHFDSEAIQNILSVLEYNENDQQRWLLSLKMLDALLIDFELDIDQKIALLTELSENFKKEMGFVKKGYRLQLDKKFRIHRKSIDEIMGASEKTSWAIPLLEIIKQRSLNVKPVAMVLLQMEMNHMLEVSLHSLLRSYIHMMINRLFRSRQRVYELVIYDMLERYYLSVKARNKYAKGKIRQVAEIE
jgi:thiopeptide-type bacteriocin biosynthesis protein